MDFLTDPLFTEFGRSDFIGGIDNEALDFDHLEQFIHVAATAGSAGKISPAASAIDVNDVLVSGHSKNESLSANTPSHLPESPPDSGSEQPFSPVDLQGLRLTSRATSNCTANDASLIDTDLPLGSQQNVKSIAGMRSFNQSTMVGHHQSSQNQPHSHITPHAPNLHQHQVYAEHNNDHHSILLTATPQPQHPTAQHESHQQPVPQASRSNIIYSSETRQDHRRDPANSTLIAHGQSQHQSNIPVDGLTETIDLDSQRTLYNRHPILMTPRPQHSSTDVYMGTPAPTIASSTNLASTRKRKLLEVDCCPSLISIKPEPGTSLSPICHQKCNPSSPVNITFQQISTNDGKELGQDAIGIGELSGGAVELLATGSPSSASLSPAAPSLSLSNDNNSLDDVGTNNMSNFANSNTNDSSSESSPMQCIRFTPFQQHNWHTLCDQSLQELSIAYYRVDADKGFNFSISDDAFVCQKKNHFQITCHARLMGDAKFVRTSTGLEKIKSFHLHFYGVKLEAPNQTIRVEQSQSDRSKKPFYPVPIDLQSHLVSKVTVGRLHFSETTNNNMRKKGRPNPEQRYFQLVVGLHVHTHSGHFPIISQGSERIIVRASNPGQFESDVELCWQRGVTPESVFHAGRVGVNTDRPDESLVVHGNLKVSGHIVQPSDSRAKQEINELDTAVQLKNLQKIRIVRYRYEPEFALHSGLKSDSDNKEIIDTGVIAQEVRKVLPDAVQEAGSIVLPSGQIIENFLLVNKDRILMENIGAVKELCKVTGSLETRIEQLEKINNRLIKMQTHNKFKKDCKLDDEDISNGEDELCSNRTIQTMIIILVVIMATCLVSVSTLYFMEHNKQRNIKRYDRYDISDHLMTHDAVLINAENNNNQRILNRNGYHVNKNEKSSLHSHIIRPTPIPSISASHQSLSNFPLLIQQPKIPISFISPINSPPDITSNDALYRENTNFDGSNSKKEDMMPERPAGEDPLALEKPVLHLQIGYLNNKTASSKNKSKWPSSEIGVSVPPTITLAYNFNGEAIDDNLNVNESSSEKVADAIPLAQDFENNSIDGVDTSQKLESRNHPIIEVTRDHGTVTGNTIKNTVHKVQENSVATADIGGFPVTSLKIENNGKSADSNPSLSPSLFVVYKSIQAKNINDAVSQQMNFTIETPSKVNKSRSIDTEDADLQNLGNSNDSDDQNLSDISSISVITKAVSLTPIGIPDHCIKIETDEISNCQSACFEDTNNVQLQGSNSEVRRRHIDIVPMTNTTSVSFPNSPSKVKGNIPPNSKSLIDETQVDGIGEIEDAQSDDIGDDHDGGSTSIKLSRLQIQSAQDIILKDKKLAHKDTKRKNEHTNDRTSLSDCTSITPWLQASTFNVSLGCEEICLSKGNSFNITYTIPLSKYLKDTNVELHFFAPNSLYWMVCSNKQTTKRDGSSFTNPVSSGKLFHKNQTVSIFYLIIPSHGHFERFIELRAAVDSTKNLCHEQADEINVLLQYNIRIIRDCD